MLLVLVEDGPDGRLSDRSAHALARAAELGGPVHAVCVGTVPAGVGDVDVVHRLRHEVFDAYAPDAIAAAVEQLVTDLGAGGVLAAATPRGDEVLARVAARTGLPLATACVAVSARGTGEPWVLTRSRGGGMLLEDAELDAACKLATLAPGATAFDTADPASSDHGTATPGAGTNGTVEQPDRPTVPFVRGGRTGPVVRDVRPVLDDRAETVRVTERVAAADGLSLETAPVVVSGGRGVGGPDGYAVLEELAGLLGGVVGCSRVATNNGWRPHSDQVGLTGARIAPRLYVACGISGATQHWVGCMHAHAILAVNTDPDAPMVTRSTWSVVGDLHEVLPAVVAELRARRAADGPPAPAERRLARR